MSVWRAQREINAREFIEWLLIEQIEPFGDDWEQAGTVAAETRNVYASRSSQMVTPGFFIPGRSAGQQSDEEIEMALTSVFNQQNARVSKGR